MLVVNPELWLCQGCDWVGVIATHYARQHFNSISFGGQDQMIPIEYEPEWPTCPGCGGHVFKIEDATYREPVIDKGVDKFDLEDESWL